MAAGDLTTLDNVKAWLGLPADAGSSDGLLADLITAASDLVSGYLGRALLSTDYVEIQDGNGAGWMLLRQAPIIAVQSVAFAGLTLTDAADPVNGTPGILFDGRRLSLLGHHFPHGAPVVVSYTAGYATPPAGVRQAVIELVGEAFKRRDRIGQTSKTLGGQETVAFLITDVNATIKTLLAPRTAPWRRSEPCSALARRRWRARRPFRGHACRRPGRGARQGRQSGRAPARPCG